VFLRRPRAVVIVLLLLVRAGSSATAQRPEVPPRFSPLTATLLPLDTGATDNTGSLALRVRGDSASIRPTHWVKGGVIGGLVLGGTLGTFTYLLCPLGDIVGDERVRLTLSAAALGGFAGFIIGALVGGAFPKGTTP